MTPPPFNSIDDLISFFEQDGEYVERAVDNGQTTIEAFHAERPAPYIDDEFLLSAMQFSECRLIDDLSIPESKVTDLSIREISHFANLEYLNLRGSQITDASLRAISQLSHLVSLDLSETQISDSGAELLQALPLLEFLNIQGTQISDEGCRFLGQLPKLTHFYLQRCPITNDCLECFQKHSQLNYINVCLTAVDGNGIGAFLTQRPNVRIDWD